MALHGGNSIPWNVVVRLSSMHIRYAPNDCSLTLDVSVEAQSHGMDSLRIAVVLSYLTTHATSNFNIYVCKIYLMQKHFWCKKARPSKVESYLEANT